MAQGEVVLNVDYNVSQAEAKQQKLTAQWEKQVLKVEQQKSKVNELRAEMERLTAEAERQKVILDGKEDITSQEASNYERIQAEAQSVSAEYEKANADLNVQNARLNEIGANIKKNTNKQDDFSKSIAKSNNPLEKFSKRVMGLVKRVFIFSVITKALRALRSAITDYIKQDDKLGKSLAEVKGNFQLMGIAIMESLRPILQFLLDKLAVITSFLTKSLTVILGQDEKSLKKMAKSSKDIEKSSKGALASFDEINTLAENTAEAQEETGVQYSDTDWTSEQLATIGTVSGLAMVGLGIILCLTGHWLLGVGLIIAGGTYAALSIKDNWDEMSREQRKKLINIATVAGLAMIGLGIILCLTGVAIPLGIGLIVAGLATATLAKSLDPDKTMEENVDNLLKKLGEKWDKYFGGVQYGWENMLDDIDRLTEDWAKKDWKNVWIDIGNIIIDVFNMIFSLIVLPFQAVAYGIAKITDAIGITKNTKWEDLSPTLIPNIPRAATGGIVPRSSLINVGEKGKEAILPLENNTDWMYTLADIINGGRTADNRPIVVQVGERAVAVANRNGENKIGGQTVYGGFANVY